MPSTSLSSLENAKPKPKVNGSILKFFKKVDPAERAAFERRGPRNGNILDYFGAKRPRSGIGDEEDGSSLFFKDKGDTEHLRREKSFDSLFEGDGFAEAKVLEAGRYNEDMGAIKRRKVERPRSGDGDALFVSSVKGGGFVKGSQLQNGACTSPPLNFEELNALEKPPKVFTGPSDTKEFKKKTRHIGPFVEDTDSEAEEDVLAPGLTPQTMIPSVDVSESEGIRELEGTSSIDSSDLRPPRLKRDETSYPAEDDFADIERIEDDDEFAGGEEMIERRWMEEQRMLEMAEDSSDPDYLDDYLAGDATLIDTEAVSGDYKKVELCPICSASLSGVSDADATTHVNHCLDGNPIPLPERNPAQAKHPSQRFQRPPKPPQPSPFALEAISNGGSAFSKLMSSNAEDAAWANAAAAETISRGKPAYTRTCPFYKILPGFFICVDAFRYGAVAGCNAYFLSHFHSDHYIGLTSSWSHGPIYCSRVTANLVRQQLRVDPKWVVDVEFEKKMDVPKTNGVAVTMISANHCPGSSLFLFEKTVGTGKIPKDQRILHCGDFRACTAHVRHPLLRSEISDSVTGKPTGQQKLDVCYLDTTYLNPRYAFPSQEEVISACADMCVSLKKDHVEEGDAWERMKKDRAGQGMVKFVEKKPDVAESFDEGGDSELTNGKREPEKKGRGRLLVVVGTYSIGKERICLGIARALKSKIYAPSNKQKICACLEDAELNALLTRNPKEAQVHMTPLMEIRAETLQDYLNGYKPHFSRVVGFRPSGWNYKPPNSRFTESPQVQTVLHSDNWKSHYSMADLVPQRGSTKEASCFGVPYSEHSSFRELTMFCCSLRIDKIIPTVNIGSSKSREKMKAWFEKWAAEKKKNGLFRIPEGQDSW